MSFIGSELSFDEKCPSEARKSALMKNVLGSEISNDEVSFRGSEISVDEKCPSDGRKSALLKISLWRSEISVVEKCPSSGRKSALLKNVLLAVGNTRC